MLTLTSEQECSLIEQAKHRLSVSASPSQQTPEGREIYRRGERAITFLLKQYERFIYGLIHRICPALEDAYSVALHGFTKALQSYDFRIPLLSWLRIKITGVLLDAVSSQQHRHRRERVLLEHLQAFKALPTSRDAALEEVPFQEFIPRIREALALLSESERLCLSLQAEGYQWAEIGELLDKSPDAARMQFTRSLQKLRLSMGVEVAKPTKVKVVPKPCWMRTLYTRLKKVVRKLRVTSDINAAVSQSEQSHDRGYNSRFVPKAQEHEAIPHKMGQSKTAHLLVCLWRVRSNARCTHTDQWFVHSSAILRCWLWALHPRAIPKENPKTGSSRGFNWYLHRLCLGVCNTASACPIFQPPFRIVNFSDYRLWNSGPRANPELGRPVL
jgi:RNA polymerase sigma factor (sigma-70 family)